MRRPQHEGQKPASTVGIPCHRVIGSDGSPTGYGGGIWRKDWLLAHEWEMMRGSRAS